jgi:hypothetical protein
MEKELAHFFWHGEISKLESNCIKSFVKNNFNVKLWSYTNIKIDGAESCDARLILPEEHLTKYQQNFSNKIMGPSLAAFGDAFRYDVIYKYGGWWFDTDCYCLVDQIKFRELREGRDLVAGFEYSNYIASGIFYAKKRAAKILVNNLNKVCEKYNYNFPGWGAIGPRLFTETFLHANHPSVLILPPYVFYAILWNEMNLFLKKERLQEAKERIKDSYITHVWNTLFKNLNIDKNNPEEGSLLYELYNKQ